MDSVASLKNDELLAECVNAAEFPMHDPQGNEALLAEVRRRGSEALFDAQSLRLLEATLGSRATVRMEDHAFSPLDPEFETAHRLLQNVLGGAARKYLFHGTLKSRLTSIQREGHIPARRAKNWGRQEYTANAASGVFFTTGWRRATDWVGASAFNANGAPVKGAIIRLPAAGLPAENDRFAASGGSVVVRLSIVSTEQAEVLLPPFSVTQPWVPLADAVNVIRGERGRENKDQGGPRRDPLYDAQVQ